MSINQIDSMNASDLVWLNEIEVPTLPSGFGVDPDWSNKQQLAHEAIYPQR